MENLKLIKSANFGTVECDFYSNGKDLYMTIDQLARCLEYSNGRKGIENLISRNEYLQKPEFSTTLRLGVVEGNRNVNRERTIFTEDGIYEVTFLSKTEKAKKFRSWVRKILKSLRTGQAKLVSMTEYQKMTIKTRSENAHIRKAQILERLSNQYDGTYKEVLQAYVTKELTGDFLLPLPQIKDKTYSATEIGEELGISSNKVGKLANRHGLKTDQYGGWFNDKAKGNNKEVQSFRYYKSIIPILQDILKSE